MSGSDPFGTDMGSATTETVPDISGMFESGAPTCKFTKIGDVHKGQIVDCKERQQTDMDTGEPENWPDGNPKMMVVMTIQTDERDPEIEGDDGTRKIYMKRPSGIYNAFIMAVKAAKAKPAIGGTVAFKYVKDGTPPKKGYNAPKEFIAIYAPPGVPLNTAPTAPVPAQSTGNINNDHKKQAKIGAWKAFVLKNPALNADTVKVAWTQAVKDYFGENVNPDAVTPGQWQNFINSGFEPTKSPISDTPEFDPAEIPY